MKIEIGNEYKVGKINVEIILRPYEWHKIIVTNLAVVDNDTWIYFSDEVQYSGKINFLELTLEKFKSYITNDPRYEVKEFKKPVDLDYQNINDKLTNLENKFNAEIKSINNVLNKMSTDILNIFLKKYKGTNNE